MNLMLFLHAIVLGTQARQYIENTCPGPLPTKKGKNKTKISWKYRHRNDALRGRETILAVWLSTLIDDRVATKSTWGREGERLVKRAGHLLQIKMKRFVRAGDIPPAPCLHVARRVSANRANTVVTRVHFVFL